MNPEDNTPELVEPEGEFALLPRKGPRHNGSILMAAMIGLADALGWDRERPDVEHAIEAGDPGGPDFDLSFGDLPPLN